MPPLLFSLLLLLLLLFPSLHYTPLGRVLNAHTHRRARPPAKVDIHYRTLGLFFLFSCRYHPHTVLRLSVFLFSPSVFIRLKKKELCPQANDVLGIVLLQWEIRTRRNRTQ